MDHSLFKCIPLVALLSGCIEVPELEEAVSDEAENAEMPRLLPIGTAIAATRDPRLDGSEAEVLSRRAEELRSEAQSSVETTSDADLEEKARNLNLRAEELRNR